MDEEKTPSLWRGIDKAKVIPVILTEAVAGSGTDDDPFRNIRQYWSLDGQLLWADDPVISKG